MKFEDFNKKLNAFYKALNKAHTKNYHNNNMLAIIKIQDDIDKLLYHGELWWS